MPELVTEVDGPRAREERRRRSEERVTIVDQMSRVAQEAVHGIEQIASHVHHPRPIGVDADAGDTFLHLRGTQSQA